MYRNRRILDLAQDYPCQACGLDDGTIVAAHSNQLRHGKGKGIKAHDVFIAYLCSACHWFVDQSGRTREAKAAVWQLGHDASVPLFSHLLDAEGWALLYP